VPYDHGHERRGSGLGPDAIVAAGGSDALTAGGLEVVPSTIAIEDGPVLPGTEVACAFAVNRALAKLVASATSAGELPVVLAGNCNSCLGTVSGARSSIESAVWFDSHADFDTPETSTNGFFGGMALAALTGACWEALCASISGYRPFPADRVLLVGTRHLSSSEESSLDEAGVARGQAFELAARLELDRPEGTYLHVDLDVLDPALAPANAWAAPDGLSPDELVGAVRRVCERRPIRAAALTAYDPAGDRAGVVSAAAARVLAVIGEALGSQSDVEDA
jgi:arginase